MKMFDLAINIIEQGIIYYFLINYLIMNDKYNKRVLTIFITMSVVTMTFLNSAIGYEGIYLCVLISINLLFSLKYSSSGYIECIFVNALVYLFIAVINGTIVIVLNLIVYNDVFTQLITGSNYFWILILLSKILLFIICRNVAKVRNSYNDIIIKYELLTMLLYVVLILIIYLHFSQILYVGVIEEKSYFVGFIALSIISISFTFAFFKMLTINKKMKNDEITILVQQNKLEIIDEVNCLNEEIISLKHDMRHLLTYLNDCLENDNVVKAKKSINSYNTKLESIKMLTITSNDILNYAINHLQSNCRKNQILLNVYITSNCIINLSDNDLMLILSNTFENAFENCAGDRWINVTIKDKDNYCIIQIENSINIECVSVNDEIKSTKKGANHGRGIKNIKNILILNDGNLDIDSSNYKFKCTMIVSNECS